MYIIFFYAYIFCRILPNFIHGLFSVWLFHNYGYADPPPIIGHLDIKDAQCAKKNDGLKISNHIVSRLGAVAVQKGRFGRPKIKISSKVVKFLG